MNLNTAPVLETRAGDAIPLKGVKIQGEISDLMASVCIQQQFENDCNENIEAVYTFPLALDAVLLELQVQIGGRTLKGCVIEKQQAEDRYEEAIAEGDTAIMLQQVASGLYTLNVGNLQPGEAVTIQYQYAQLLVWMGDDLRFHIPTTIAPRYGDPEKQFAEPHQIPLTNNWVEHQYTLSVQVKGLLSKAVIQSPSHSIAMEAGQVVTRITLDRGAKLDRDFVLNFAADAAEVTSACQIAGDITGHVALVSFKPKIEHQAIPEPRNIKIVVDCSGSMAGDSIDQARQALRSILASLRAQDCFNIILFGSHHDALFSGAQQATAENLRLAGKLVDRLNANMGGTEIGEALKASYALGNGHEIASDVLLITDGEIWNQEVIIQEAQESGHRIFTVGVGSSVSESFVRTMARVTGGACELVTPNEQMAEKIHRHFQRIYLPKAENLLVDWPATPKKQWPEKVESCFDGDTLHVFAWFDEPILGPVSLLGDVGNGSQQKLAVSDGVANSASGGDLTLARIAAAQELKAMPDSPASKEMAVQYQIITPHTNYLVLDVREEKEKAKSLPVLAQVPQMLAAGWGGCASVHYDSCMVMDENLNEIVKNALKKKGEISAASLIRYLNELPFSRIKEGLIDSSIQELRENGLEERFAVTLEGVVNDSRQMTTEQQVILLLLLELYGLGSWLFSKDFSRALMLSKRKMYEAPNDCVSNEQVLALIKDVATNLLTQVLAEEPVAEK